MMKLNQNELFRMATVLSVSSVVKIPILEPFVTIREIRV